MAVNTTDGLSNSSISLSLSDLQSLTRTVYNARQTSRGVSDRGFGIPLETYLSIGVVSACQCVKCSQSRAVLAGQCLTPPPRSSERRFRALSPNHLKCPAPSSNTPRYQHHNTANIPEPDNSLQKIAGSKLRIEWVWPIGGIC